MADHIELTEAARRHLQGQPQPLFLSVTSKGCGGHTFRLNNTPVAPVVAHDLGHGVLFIAEHALPLLAGTEIDYVSTPLEAKLVFRHRHPVCGCGQSFSACP